MIKLRRALLLGALVSLAAGTSTAATIVSAVLDASLTTGSLAGTTFLVTYSYDASLITPAGANYIPLNSFDFTLLGVNFTKANIQEGGQVLFDNDVLENVTASFQIVLPPNSPVNDITFGFGDPGVIGYSDLARNFGEGSFTFSQVPEPGTLMLLGPLAALLWRVRRRARSEPGAISFSECRSRCSNPPRICGS
jgi:hypothetical protein